MGKKLEANYNSSCKVCGETWNKGEEICWDKVAGKTVTCTDIDCFSHQGGSLSFTKKAFGDPTNIIITKNKIYFILYIATNSELSDLSPFSFSFSYHHCVVFVFVLMLFFCCY